MKNNLALSATVLGPLVLVGVVSVWSPLAGLILSAVIIAAAMVAAIAPEFIQGIKHEKRVEELHRFRARQERAIARHQATLR